MTIVTQYEPSAITTSLLLIHKVFPFITVNDHATVEGILPPELAGILVAVAQIPVVVAHLRIPHPNEVVELMIIYKTVVEESP